jgi:hypothetical protein
VQVTPARLLNDVAASAQEAGPADGRRTVVFVAPDGRRYQADAVFLHGPVLGRMRVAVTLTPFTGHDPQ